MQCMPIHLVSRITLHTWGLEQNAAPRFETQSYTKVYIMKVVILLVLSGLSSSSGTKTLLRSDISLKEFCSIT